MDRLPTNIRSLIFDELLSEKMSYGQYEKELTLCNLSLLRIVGYFSCISQVHQHPPLPPPQEQTEFLQIPHGHWSFCVSFPLPALLSFSSRFWDPVENCQCFPPFLLCSLVPDAFYANPRLLNPEIYLHYLI